MKHSRDEIFSTIPKKRRMGSYRQKSNGKLQINEGGSSSRAGIEKNVVEGSGGGGERKPTTEDAAIYLDKVEKAFAENKETYRLFSDILESLESERFDIDAIKTVVKDLFEGHPDLIIGFNTFLPKGCETTLKEIKPMKKKIEFQDSLSFIGKIKERFGNDGEVYKSFVEMIFMSDMNQRNPIEVYHDATKIFKGHPDLVEEFKKFLPEDE